MALQYLLDGYNMVMRIPELLKKEGGVSFEASREGLVDFLSRYRPQGNAQNPATLVFDGYAAMKLNWERLRQEAIQIIFSEGESADDRIVSMIGKSGPQTIVVTDDRELSLRVKELRAKSISVQEFIAKVVDKHKKVSEAEDTKKKLTPKEEQSITEELKKIWLKKS